MTKRKVAAKKPAATIKVPEPERKPNQIKKVGGIPFMFWGGVALTVFSIVLVTIYFIYPELMLLGYAAVILLGIGILLTWAGWKKRAGGVIFDSPASSGMDVPKQQGTFNTLTISRNKITFEYLDPKKDTKAYGHPRKCRNDGKYYYVRIEHIDSPEIYQELILPDTYEYYDPKEYANLLQLPAWRRYNEREANLWEKLSPGFLVLAQVGMLIALIALNSPGG